MSQPPVLKLLKAYGVLMLTLILLSVWYTYHPQTCISFVFGVFFTPTAAAIGILLYIKRLPKTTDSDSNSNIKIHLAKVEPSDVNQQGDLRTIRSAGNMPKELEEISPSSNEQSLLKPPPCRFSAFEMQSRISSATELNLTNIKKDSIKESIVNSFKGGRRMTKQSSFKEIVLGRGRSATSQISPIMKIGHREFKTELDELTMLFKFISGAERAYGKGFQGLPIRQYTTKEEDVKCQLKDMNDQDLLFLTRKYNRGFQSGEAFAISDLNKLKENLAFVGELHLNCSAVVEKVSVNKIDMMKIDYEEQYLAMKHDKKDHVGAYEDAQQDFTNLKKEQEELEKYLKTILDEYQNKCDNREDSEILLKYEMKARRAKLQLDSLKNKVVEAEDKLNECKSGLDEENDKISLFIKNWETKKLTVCQSTFKSLILTLRDKIDNAEKILSVLISPANAERYIEPKNLGVHHQEVEMEVEEEGLSIAEEMRISGKSVSISFEKKEGKRKRFFKALVRPIKQGAHMLMHKDEISENKENQSNILNSLSTITPTSNIKQTFMDMRGKLDFYNGKCIQQTKKYDEEVGKARDMLNLMRQIIENQDSYMKEEKKFLFYEPIYLKAEVLANYLKILKSSICTTKEINSHLFEKICTIEKRYSDHMNALQHTIEDNNALTQKALKSAARFIKYQEASTTSEPSFKQSVKKILHRSAYEVKPHLIGASARLPSEQEIDQDFFEDKESVFKSLEESIALKKNIIKTLRQKSLIAKKDTIIAILQCYTRQKEEFAALFNKVERINDCIEEDKDVITALAVVATQIGKTEEPKNVEITVSSLHMNQSDLSRNASQNMSQNLSQTSPDLVLEKLPSQLLRANSSEISGRSFDEEVKDGPQGLSWLNNMLTLFFQEWPQSPVFKDKMMKAVFKLLNRRKRRFIQQMQVKDFNMERKAPEIRKVTVLSADKTEFICDFEISHKGAVYVEIETKLETEGFLNALAKDYCVAVRARVLLKRVNAKVRLCWKLPENGPSWISFIGEPAMDINVEPLLGNGLFNVGVFPKVESILRKVIAKKLRKLTYPNQKVIKFPLYQAS